jgi:hypothetical protein
MPVRYGGTTLSRTHGVWPTSLLLPQQTLNGPDLVMRFIQPYFACTFSTMRRYDVRVGEPLSVTDRMM